MKRRIALIGVLAAALACSSGPTTDNNQNGGNNQPPVLPGGTPVASANVDVANDFYAPNSVLLAAGGTVTWNWTGDHGHSVTSNVFQPNAPVSYPPHSLSVTFPSTGDFAYFCTVHGVSGYGVAGTMVGTIYVR